MGRQVSPPCHEISPANKSRRPDRRPGLLSISLPRGKPHHLRNKTRAWAAGRRIEGSAKLPDNGPHLCGPHRRQSACFEDLDSRLIVIGTHADGITAAPVRKAGGRSIVRRRYAGALQQSAHALGVGDGAAEQKIIWQCQRLPYPQYMPLLIRRATFQMTAKALSHLPKLIVMPCRSTAAGH